MYQRALNAALNEGVRALNLSIGGTQSSRTEELLFRRLINAGVAVAAAMGNEYRSGNPIEYPANYPSVIAVGATNEADQRRALLEHRPQHHACSAGNQYPFMPADEAIARSSRYSICRMEWHLDGDSARNGRRGPGDCPKQGQ
jgi:hypothetical protein